MPCCISILPNWPPPRIPIVLLFSKLFSFIIFLVGISICFLQGSYADCDISTPGTSAAEFLAGCSESSPGGISVSASTDISGTTSDIKQKVKDIAERAIAFGALFAVGMIVWAGIQYTKSFWEDESLKKAKNTGIYAVIWLLLLLASFGLVDIVIKFVFDLGSN